MATLPAHAAPALTPARAWVAALRLRTLTAGAMPVLVGLALAWAAGAWQPWVAGATLGAALLIQVGVNLANDYYDHVKGVDKPDRMGPARAAGKLLPAARVRGAMVLVLGAAALLGLALVLHGGWPVLAIGLASLLCAVAYAGGPRPLGHAGLGDAFVFAFFGPVAVMGTFYLQAGAWPPDALLAGAAMGALSAAILVVNNVRDIPTDARAGKRTLAVRIGARASWAEYALLLALAFAVPFALLAQHGPWVLLPLLALPLGAALAAQGARSAGGPALNALLVRTAGLHALYGALLALGVAL